MINQYFLRGRWKTTVPGRTSVTFQSLVLANDVTQTFISYKLFVAKSRPYSGAEDKQSGIVIDSLPTRNWEIWQDWLDAAVLISTGQPTGAPAPKEGDRIVDLAGAVWQVQKFDKNLMGSVYILPTQRIS